MGKGPKHSGQNAKPSKKAGWRKKSSVTGGKGASLEERRAYHAAKQAGARDAKAKSRKERNKLRAAARKSSKTGFSESRAKDRRPTPSEVASVTSK